MTDSTPPTTGDELPATAWVTVAEAAEKSGVGTSTVRQWYRSGRLPTQRAQGDRGAFLVPLDLVLALADGADAEGEALAAEVIDLNASYWSAQTEAAREEATAARNELAEARTELQAALDQVDFLRGQLAEATDEARRLRDEREPADAATVASDDAETDRLRDELRDVQSELADLRMELARAHGDLAGVRGDLEQQAEELRRTSEELAEANAEIDRTARDLQRAEGELEVTKRQLARSQTELAKLEEISSAVGSITDNSWLDLPTNTYRSPVRPQGMAAAGDALSGLLAATQPDPVRDEAPAVDPWAAEPELEPIELAHDPTAPDESVTPPPRPHHQLGQHDDDLLPQPEKKGRRGRR